VKLRTVFAIKNLINTKETLRANFLQVCLILKIAKLVLQLNLNHFWIYFLPPMYLKDASQCDERPMKSSLVRQDG
jgi:hypothetical protein